MLQPSWIFGALPAFLSLANGAAIESRQSAATQVVKLSSVENIAVRPDGQILATNMNNPALYAIDPVAKTSSTAITITGSAGLSGIREVAPDVFAVIGGQPQGTAVYQVDFTGAAPTQKLVAKVSGASNMNGMTVLNNSTVLLGDAGKGAIYAFNMATGESSIAASDPTMAPQGSIPFGIDGLVYKDGFVYYSNIFKNSFHKIAVDPHTGKSTGTATTFWTNLMGDDMCLGPNGKIYLATNGGNSLVEVDATATTGQPKSVASITGSTSCAFGRTEKDKNVAYVGAGQGVYAVTISQ